MSWATPYVKQLMAGKTVSFRPSGNSMAPRIKSGQLCTVEPLSPDHCCLIPGDVVLCKVGAAQYYLHLVQEVQGDRYLIGNNRGGVNGWLKASSIYGRLVRLDP